MKFMKLGSKPDAFGTHGNNARYVATELATDIIVNVGDIKFYLHKFPLLSKSARLQKLMLTTSLESDIEVHIPDIPGGPAAFEICAKFCYGMTVTLNAYNVVAARCAAEYLEMHETVDKGNLIYKIEVFLNSSIFRGWKDSIIVLQTTRSLMPWVEDLKVTNRCIDSIASKASMDPSKVDWSYTYNKKKLLSENGMDPHWNGVRKQQLVPKDWWVEDLCELDINFYKHVILTIKSKGMISGEVIGEALKAYALRRLPGSSKNQINSGDLVRNRSLFETIIWLLPMEKGSVSCSFLLKLLKTASLLDAGETLKRELVKRIGRQLEEASMTDLLILAPPGGDLVYDVDLVQGILEEFFIQKQSTQTDESMDGKLLEGRSPTSVSSASKLTVAKLIDEYLVEISRDPNLPLLKFVEFAEMVSDTARPVHDGLYRAIDMYLKEHIGLSKGEKKRICRLMDCKKLSMDACMHAAQNERLPLRVVVQILFFEQIRATSTAGGCPPANLPGSIRALLPHENGGSHGSLRSATNTEDDWDAGPTAEELKCLKGEIAAMRLGGENNGGAEVKNSENRSKVKGILTSKKIFNKIWSSKGQGESSSSDTSESPSDSVNEGETKSTTSKSSRRHSVS